VNELSDFEGCEKFVHSCKQVSKTDGIDLVGFVSTIMKYHNHDDLSIGSLIRTRKHFKNLAFTYLDKDEDEKFRSWMNNWIDMILICKKVNPNEWEKKRSFENTRDKERLTE
jgi:hypothetical protein